MAEGLDKFGDDKGEKAIADPKDTKGVEGLANPDDWKGERGIGGDTKFNLFEAGDKPDETAEEADKLISTNLREGRTPGEDDFGKFGLQDGESEPPRSNGFDGFVEPGETEPSEKREGDSENGGGDEAEEKRDRAV